MWPDRRLGDLLGIEHPILQAPMLGSCSPALAAAVSGAGALGAHGCGALPADEVRARLAAVRRLTNAPVNFNFFVLEPDPRAPAPAAMAALQAQFDAAGLGTVPEVPDAPAPAPEPEVIDAICEAAPRVVSFHFGLPGDEAMARLRAAGIRVLSTATSVAEAEALEAAGVDAIIAQGWEAGGHRGSHAPVLPHEGVGTMALVPQIVDAVRCPVIAAGGIADARGIVAALALGAAGVQMGTAFLRCPEAVTTPAHLDRLAEARDEATMASDAVSGRVARAAVHPYLRDMLPHAGDLPGFPQLYGVTDPLRQAGAAEFWLYGQAGALARAVPAARLVEDLVREAQALTGRLRFG